MKEEQKFQDIPKEIAVSVTYGESGCLIAHLLEFDIYTEADTMNQLFLQVNDLIYTYFDIPKEFQNSIMYIPPIEVARKLASKNPPKKSYNNIMFDAFYTKELCERIYA